jgi:hypothetical protein
MLLAKVSKKNGTWKAFGLNYSFLKFFINIFETDEFKTTSGYLKNFLKEHLWLIKVF